MLADPLPRKRSILPPLAVESLAMERKLPERLMLSASNEETAAAARCLVRFFFVAFLHLAARLCDLVARHFLAAALAVPPGAACATAERLSTTTAASARLHSRRVADMRVYLSRR